MTTTVEVFAEITCPFAYVGLRHVVDHVVHSVTHHHAVDDVADPTLDRVTEPVDIVVRAWPLEWVNGAGLQFDGVATKAEALREQLGVDAFNGLRADTWPTSTIPALGLTAAAYTVGVPTGLAVSTELRTALFELGVDISNSDELAEIADAHGIEFEPDDDRAVRADYAEGRARGVQGSPHYFVASDDFFCPALDLGRDADDHLTARFDPDGLARFLASVRL
jgi:predicted DsbA family dithiol-disulfide isomerase